MASLTRHDSGDDTKQDRRHRRGNVTIKMATYYYNPKCRQGVLLSLVVGLFLLVTMHVLDGHNRPLRRMTRAAAYRLRSSKGSKRLGANAEEPSYVSWYSSFYPGESEDPSAEQEDDDDDHWFTYDAKEQESDEEEQEQMEQLMMLELGQGEDDESQETTSNWEESEQDDDDNYDEIDDDKFEEFEEDYDDIKHTGLKSSSANSFFGDLMNSWTGSVQDEEESSWDTGSDEVDEEDDDTAATGRYDDDDDESYDNLDAQDDDVAVAVAE